MFDRDYVFYGKHATYAKFLCKDRGVEKDDRANVFNRELDVLMVAPLVGILKNRFVPENDNENSDKSTVQLSQLSGERTRLMQIYRMVMLSNPNDEIGDIDKINLAFRHDGETDDQNTTGWSILNGYIRGGVEVLYEIFKDDLGTGANKKYIQAGEIMDMVLDWQDD